MAAITVSTEDANEIEQIRKGIADYIHTKSGGQVRDVTVDCCIDEVRAYATTRGLTPIAAARDLCKTTSNYLRTHNDDAMAACLAADADVGIDGVTLLALVIHQERVRAKTANQTEKENVA